MKAFIRLSAWSAVAVVVMFAALNPDGGVIYQSPAAMLGLAMIGVGLCKQAKQRQAIAVRRQS